MIISINEYKIHLNESKNINSFKKELIDIESNSDFKSWLKERGFDQSKIDSFKRYDAINGLCGELAAYLYFKYKAKIFYIEIPEISDGHQFVQYRDLYYDAMDPEGVETPGNLHWAKQFSDKASKSKIDKSFKKLRITDDFYNQFGDEAEKFGWVKYDDKTGKYKLV